MNEKPKSVIVCAAIRKNGLIVCGARHFDTIMRAQLKAMNPEPNYGGRGRYADPQSGTNDKPAAGLLLRSPCKP